MNKKKLLVLAMTLSMVAILAIGGTLAYFTDAEKITNTMTVGNVEINIEEYAYKNGKWEDFKNNDFVLYPTTNAQGQVLFNKSVRTYNTSPSKDAAYIRTIVLIEKNNLLTDTYVNEGGVNCCFPGMHFAADGAVNDATHGSGVAGQGQLHTCKEGGHLEQAVTIDGKEYWVVWFVVADEKTAIPYGEALSSLLGVHMDKNITSEQIEGWGKDGVQVIAFSQAIQENGLTHAQAMKELGEITEANLQSWLTGENAAENAMINDWNKTSATDDETTGA